MMTKNLTEKIQTSFTFSLMDIVWQFDDIEFVDSVFIDLYDNRVDFFDAIFGEVCKTRRMRLSNAK